MITPYEPQTADRGFLKRAHSETGDGVEATVAVLDSVESERYFGVPLARRGIQPVYLRVENHSQTPLRLQLVRVDPNYYTPLEAAAASHFSIVQRLSAFGFMGWLFVPLLALVPLKLITAWRANRRMDEFFRTQGFRLRPIEPGQAAAGFVFTPVDAGTKMVHVCLHATGQSLADAVAGEQAGHLVAPAVEFTFSVPVPGLAADYLHRDLDAIQRNTAGTECDVTTLVNHLRALSPETTNLSGSRSGDPVNLVVIGNFDTLLSAFASRWDESETITFSSCWRTVRSFLIGTQYRYSPVSPLYLLGRSQDIALQRTRHSINERLHLRLWFSPWRFQGQPVWVGQVSRDIGVRFTYKTWNLTTHRIDPEVDESRDYVLEDLLHAQRVDAAGYVDGVGACQDLPRRNLTGDPYYTDGNRVVILLSTARTAPKFVSWG